MIKVVTYLMQ